MTAEHDDRVPPDEGGMPADVVLGTNLAQLNTVLGDAPIGLALLDAQGVFLYAAEPFAIAFGLTRAALTGRPLGEALPDAAAMLTPLHERVVSERTIGFADLSRVPRPNARPLYFSVLMYPIRATTGRETIVGAMVANTTPRQRAEQARARAEARYRDIFENAVEAIFQTGFDGRFHDANPAAARMLGYASPQELLAENPEIASLYVDPSRLRDFIAEIAQHGSVSNFEIEVYRRDRTTLWISLSARALRDDAGTIIGAEGMATDITERKHAEQALTQLAAIVESSDDAILSISLDGTIRSWNAGAERLYGYRADEAVGRRLTMLAPPGLGDEIPSLLERLRRGEPIDRFYTRRRRKDGSIIDVSVIMSVMRNSAGEVFGASVITRDNTEARRLAEEQRRLREQERAARAAAAAAAEADQLKNELLSTVSHELRTPLAAIKGFTTTLLAYFDRLNQEERISFLEEIDGAADRLQELVDNLLRLSRLEAGTLAMRLEPIDLADVLSRFLDDARRRYRDRVITLDIVGTLPVVDADPRRLSQVLANLVDNAVKYSPEGGEVALHARTAANGGVDIAVSDQGIGIAPEHLSRVFDRFYRVDNAQTEKIGGTGLGLAICRRIIESHGGAIRVTSTEGAGTTFTVHLPRGSET